jgi:hypothetical protein
MNTNQVAPMEQPIEGSKLEIVGVFVGDDRSWHGIVPGKVC